MGADVVGAATGLAERAPPRPRHRLRRPLPAPAAAPPAPPRTMSVAADWAMNLAWVPVARMALGTGPPRPRRA